MYNKARCDSRFNKSIYVYTHTHSAGRTHVEDKGKESCTKASQPLYNKAIFPVRESDDGGGEGRRRARMLGAGEATVQARPPRVAGLPKHEGSSRGG